MKRQLKHTTLLLLPVLLSGCSGSTVEIASNLVCKSWRPVTVSKDDKLTEKTASQIEGNNEARKAVGCNKGSV